VNNVLDAAIDASYETPPAHSGGEDHNVASSHRWAQGFDWDMPPVVARGAELVQGFLMVYEYCDQGRQDYHPT
jgi:CRISPR/Cas system-associated exonuclease Cas4 (RecB family)